MEMGEKRVVVMHVEKGIIVDSKKQMCRWMCMTKNFKWECDGEIPISILINTFKYVETHLITLKSIEIY